MLVLNFIWVILLATGVLAAAAQGNIGIATEAAISGAAKAIDLAIELAAGMLLWLGLLALLKESGLLQKLAGLLSPLLRRLFPDLSRESEAFGNIVLNFSANLLGLGNAATPFGIKAMQELNRANPNPDTATDDMITLLVLNTTAPTLLPATVIALRSAMGSANPAEIVPVCFTASLFGMAVGLAVHFWLRRFF